MQTGRLNIENSNLIDDMISHDEIYSKAGVVIETQTEEQKKDSHSIACGDDNIQQITSTTSTDARDMVKDLVQQKTI